MRRLARAGFKKEFVRPALLPDWWDDSCSQDSNLLPDVEIRVARFLGLPLSMVKDPEASLAAPAYPRAQLRRVRDIDRDRLGPAIHSALKIAGAVVRNLRSAGTSSLAPPPEGLAWRERISRTRSAVTLDDILSDVWNRGIAVIPLSAMPAPTFQGLACIVEGKPVILLGHKNDEPGRVAFIVAHEVGHIAAGDCTPEQPVVDEEDEVIDNDDMEKRADQFATRVLVGGDTVPAIDGGDFRSLAKRASEQEKATGADASNIIFAWARRTGDYTKATMAVKALYRASGARQKLSLHFDRNVDLTDASDTDRTLLRCVQGQHSDDATSD